MQNNTDQELSTAIAPFFEKISNFVDYLANEALTYAPYLTVIAVIIAGLLYITGNRDGGKKALIAAITGTVIIVLSYVMVSILNTELTHG